MRRLLAIAIMTLALVLTPSIAFANTYGWTWADPVVTVYDGTSQSRWKVAEAASEWSRAKGIDFVMVGNAMDADVVVTEEATGYVGVAEWTRNASGNTVYCTIKLDPSPVYNSVAEHAAIHELGHCGGVAHNSTYIRNSVMNAGVDANSAVDRPSARDIKEMQKAQAFRN